MKYFLILLYKGGVVNIVTYTEGEQVARAEYMRFITMLDRLAPGQTAATAGIKFDAAQFLNQVDNYEQRSLPTRNGRQVQQPE